MLGLPFILFVAYQTTIGMLSIAFLFVSPIATLQRLSPWLTDFDTKELHKDFFPYAMATTAGFIPY